MYTHICVYIEQQEVTLKRQKVFAKFSEWNTAIGVCGFKTGVLFYFEMQKKNN